MESIQKSFAKRMSSKLKSIIYVLLCVLFWALIPIVSKLGQTDLDNHQFLFWSSVVSVLTFLLVNLVQKSFSKYKKISQWNWLQAIFLGLLGTYLYYILLYFAYANAIGIEVLVIQYSWPIFVLVLSVLILKEKLNGRKILSILLGFAGVLLILSKGNFNNIHLDNLFVNGVVLLAAIVFALFSVLSKKVKLEALPLTTIYFITATLASFLSMIILSEFKVPSSNSLIPIFINGIFVNGISYILWINALKYSNASFVAPFIFLTPVISMILLILFFKEELQLIYIVGMLFVLLGGIINRE